MLSTPILLIVFNRPEIAQKTLNQIRKVKPQYLFIAADGPRFDKPKDISKCVATRKIIDQIDWECDLKTLFCKQNKGCGLGPAEAITWFFEQVEEGIVLEDDCLPNIDFFSYCKELLEYYRNNEKVFFIGGTNFQDGRHYGDGSYYFSAGNQATWGWASWRRAWQNFDFYLEKLELRSFKKVIKKYFPDRRQQEYWVDIFINVKKNQYNNSCWDYQFYFLVWLNDGLAVVPNVNLVTNIGYTIEGTHTTNETHPFANINNGSVLPLKHPNSIIYTGEADFYLHKTYIQPQEYNNTYYLWKLKKILVYCKKIFNKPI